MKTILILLITIPVVTIFMLGLYVAWADIRSNYHRNFKK